MKPDLTLQEIESFFGEKPVYEKPPVVEVACGVQFSPIEDIPASITTFKEVFHEFTQHEKKPALPPGMIAPHTGKEISLEHIDNLPGNSRYWFMRPDRTRLIQIQKDRFIYNWQKIADAPYPSFENVFPAFKTAFMDFSKALNDKRIGSLEIRCFELAYVNHIELSEDLLSGISSIGEMFPDFSWKKDKKRKIGNFEYFHWGAEFRLPFEAGAMLCTIENGQVEEKPIVSFELRTIGLPKHPQDLHDIALVNWFHIAHGSIIASFEEMISEKYKETWKQRR